MSTAARRRTFSAMALSVIAHVAVLAVLALHTPMLRMPVESSGPPEPIIPILILPRTPPPPQDATARPTPVRLHRRPLRHLQTPLPIEPLPAPQAEASASPAKGRVELHPAPLPEGPKGDVRAALRQGPVGCANVQAVGLNGSEREHCNDVLGTGAKTAPFLGLGLKADKQFDFDKANAAKQSYQRYKRGNIPSGVKGIGVGETEPFRTNLP
ncbi:MAG: hypothetical protein ABW360_18255 [Phenylobacterium sp.]